MKLIESWQIPQRTALTAVLQESYKNQEKKKEKSKNNLEKNPKKDTKIERFFTFFSLFS